MNFVSVIIVAAGSSRRMGFDKLAAVLDGKSVLALTVDAFMRCRLVDEIILVAPVERMELLDVGKFTKPLRRVDGGKERFLSVARGLDAVGEGAKLIAVHDAARPFVSQADILAAISAAEEHGAASLARRVTETLKRTDDSDFTREPVGRENLWMIETPQVFHADLLRSAYAHVIQENILVTDETSAVESIGQHTKLVASTSPNHKITTPADLLR
jgi:2-C-methyl-D-erythritol 4-phosphate cytidylyltransferase